MPHLIIEYTADLDLHPDFDARALLGAGLQAVRDAGVYDMPSAKGRIRPLDVFSLDHPHSGKAFVSVVLRILPGRTVEQRRDTSRAITDAVVATLPAAAAVTVSTEVVEMERESYTKVAVGVRPGTESR